MKFSAVAKQVRSALGPMLRGGRRWIDWCVCVITEKCSPKVVIPAKPLESLAPCLVRCDGRPLVRNGVIDSQALESLLSEDEQLDEEDEADVSLMPHNVWLPVTDLSLEGQCVLGRHH